MNFYSLLKISRVITAVISILLVTFVFIDIYNLIPQETARYIALIQFIPSLLSFIGKPSVICSFFIVILITTILAGRGYCSFLCPLGILQDIIARLSARLRIRAKMGFTHPHDTLRYTLLVFTAVSFPAAGTLLISWLDPFSIYGRISSNVLSPPYILLNNKAALFLTKFNVYSMHSSDFKHASVSVVLAVVLFTLFVTILSIFRGRLYCNTVCPVGALLGLISRISFFRISLEHQSCISCGKCEKICKSSCINCSDDIMDFSRCVLCLNCLKVCPTSGIRFRFAYTGGIISFARSSCDNEPESFIYNAKISRRNFMAGLALFPAVLSAEGKVEKKVLYYQDRSRQMEYRKLVYTSPPGSSGIDSFNERCTACSLCITRCPSSVLQPAVMQYGLNGIMHPFLDFSSGYCNYDCIMCSGVCPTGAISRINAAEKHLIQTGKSFFIKENCITYTNGTVCGACSEHCPTKAVNMVPFRNDLVIPEINQATCVGCGACEYVCPVRPLRAIYVEGNRIHEKAELPKKEKKIVIEKEGFPF